jgi:hypothetical protein
MMPTAPAFNVERNSIDPAIASCIQGTRALVVLSSGVRIMPPVSHSARNRMPTAARMMMLVYDSDRKMVSSKRLAQLLALTARSTT